MSEEQRESWEDEGGSFIDDDEWPFDDEIYDEDIPLEKWDDIDDIDDYKYVEEKD